jgi:uncharacterized protein (DUF4213/DUF364 family)
MGVISDLLAELPDGEVRDVRIGAFWTIVVVEVQGHGRCGLASTVRDEGHHHTNTAAVRDAGRLTECSAQALAGLARSESLLERSIGMAAINALLPPRPDLWTEVNAEEVIARHGKDKRVALVGHFPFVERLKGRVGTLWVLEQQPQGDDLPADAAPDVIPQADVLATTSITLINRTFDDLMALRRPDALVLLLGPSTPLSPLLFEHGVDILSGSIVADVEAVLRGVSQGANFRQLHRLGVRLVTMQKV